MEKEEEIKSLKEKLGSLNAKIQGELDKIEAIKLKISKSYRRRDKEKYEAEGKAIMLNLKEYEKDMEAIKKRLSELEAVP